MANIVLNKFTDASSSVYPFQPANAVDQVYSSINRWLGSSPLSPTGTFDSNWLRVALGSPFWISRWVVNQLGDKGWSANYNLTDYKLQGSNDNTNWFDIDSVTNNSANKTDRTFNPVKAQWIRVNVSKGLRCNPNFASIADFEAYEVNNPPYLSGLTMKSNTVNVPMSPVFSSRNFSYTASADGTTASVDVTPTSAAGSIKVNNTPVNSGSPINVPLTGSNSTITITVTSPDNLMTESYTVTVTKSVKSAFLSGLTVNGIRGSLNPSFSTSTMSYTANVAGGVTSVTVTPTAVDRQANIKVNTVTVPSGQISQAVNLNVGQNTITILVTAADNSNSQTYTVVVSRPS